MTNNQLAEIKSFSEGEIQTIRDTIAKGTTPAQFALFVRTAEKAGLNPLLNHMHCIVYNGKEGPTMSIQIAVEGIKYLARKSEGYKGIETQLVHENDEFKMGRNEEGKMAIKQHDWGVNRGQVLGGYSIAKREGFDDVIVYLEVDEIEHMKKGRNGNMWRDWFNDMFKKHIEKRAAKLQYGIEIAEDDLVNSNGQGSDIDPYQRPERKDITPDAEPKKEDKAPSSNPKPNPIDEKKQEVMKRFEQLGLNDRDSQVKYMEVNFPKALDNPTLQDFEGLIAVLDMNIERNQYSDDNLPD